jgi:hypothetical protein
VTDPQFFALNTRESSALQIRRSETIGMNLMKKDDAHDLAPQRSTTFHETAINYHEPNLLAKLKKNSENRDQ